MIKDEVLENKQENNLDYMITDMQQQLLIIDADAIKADNGNKAAGTRVRKGMQDIINAAKEVRKAVLAKRN